ncbi:MAG: undecaprenyldiphospho-muramoylpentapeptide beta-N-acetylglucosaminyltransferase [bacterium]
MKIILSGGGTGGSITPLLAIAEEIKLSKKSVDFLWIGTRNGLEEQMAEKENIKFKAIYSGKLRRYFSFKNFIDIFRIKLGFFQSFRIIYKFKPDMIITAGSFVAVPVVWAGWILKAPILVHQQDVKVGLANKLMTPFASIITCSIEESVVDFRRNEGNDSMCRIQKRICFTGNAIRRNILDCQRKRHPVISSSTERDIPIILVLGGGTGALAVNKIVVQSILELTKICNVIHITGGKFPNSCRNEALPRLHRENSYRRHSFLNNIEEAYAESDLVISRAGMGVLSELAVLKKPVIIIPIPDSHQEANAKYFADRNAAVFLNQKDLTPEILASTVKNILADKSRLSRLSENISKIMPRDGAKKIAEIIMGEIRK